MKIIADRRVCEGLGMCEAMAHEFFQVGEDGLVEVLDETPSADHREMVQAAVDACPVSALKIRF
jgi:ferredoxin